MKKLTLVLLVVAAVACGKEDTDPKVKCTADCNGALKSAAGTVITSCVQLSSSDWASGTVSCNLSTCEVNTSGCQATSFAQEGDPCVGSGQANCAAGLICIDLTGEGKTCAATCDPNATVSTCTGSTYCQNVGSGSVCFPMSAHGEACLDHAACPGEEMCLDMMYGGMGACTDFCAFDDLNATGTCGTGEYCLATDSLYYDQTTFVQCPGGNGDCSTGYTCETFTDGSFCVDADGYPETTPCTPDTEGDVCDVANGSRCYEFTTSSECVILGTVCAQHVAVWDGTEDADGYIPESFLCGYGAALCGMVGVAEPAAEVSCVSVFADADYLGICIAVCDAEFNDDVEMNCGTGFTCDFAADDDPRGMFAVIQQDGDGNRVTCTTADTSLCDELHPNCTAFQTETGTASFCNRSAMVCLPTTP